MKFLKQSALLILPFVFVLIWQLTILSKFTLQTIAFLIILYLVLSAVKRKQKDAVFFGGSVDIFIFTTIVLLLVLATGNYNSGIFFLLYFLCFGIAFVFQPTTVFSFVIYVAILLTFLGYTQPDGVSFAESIGNYLKLGSLVLLSPLAFFFGRQLRKEDEQTEQLEEIEERNTDSADIISSDVEQVLRREKELHPDDVEKLDEVLEETETLRKKTKK